MSVASRSVRVIVMGLCLFATGVQAGPLTTLTHKLTAAMRAAAP